MSHSIQIEFVRRGFGSLQVYFIFLISPPFFSSKKSDKMRSKRKKRNRKNCIRFGPHSNKLYPGLGNVECNGRGNGEECWWGPKDYWPQRGKMYSFLEGECSIQKGEKAGKFLLQIEAVKKGRRKGEIEPICGYIFV
jgi:hypothetical protein